MTIKEPDFVWPWTLEDFRGSPADRQSVIENLVKRNFPVNQLKKNPPSEKVIAATKHILTLMVEAESNGDLPWALVVSNSNALLQSISTIAPITYTLTTMGSCAITSTNGLMDLFQHRHNSFDLDASDFMLDDLKKSGFLSWRNIKDKVQGTSKQSGRFSDFLESRLRRSQFTMFTATYAEWRPDFVHRMTLELEKEMGSTVASMIKGISLLVRLTTQEPETAFKSLEV